MLHIDSEISKHKYTITMIIIVFIAFINFGVGCNWGITSIFQPDESKLVSPVRMMVESKVLLHDYWAYPAQVSSKILAFFLIIWNKFIPLKPIQYFFANRFLYSILGSAIVFLSWKIVKRIKDEKFAIVFAAIMSVCPIWSSFSKQVTGDIPALFFSLLVLYMAQMLIKTEQKKYLILMSFFAACATLEKWHGAWVCFFIVAVVLLCCQGSFSKFITDGMISLASYLMGIVILAPNILIDFKGVIEGIRFTYVYDGTIENPSISAYPAFFFTHLGIISVVFVIIGICNIFKLTQNSNLEYYVVYMFSPICLLVFWMFMRRTSFSRWGCGIYWGIILFLVDGIWALIHDKSKSVKVIGVIGFAMVFLCFASESLLVDLIAIYSNKDSRIVGEEVLSGIGATNENTLSDYYTTLSPGGMREAGEGVPIAFRDYGSDFAYEEDGTSYMRYDNIKYVVIGGYYGQKNIDGYAVVKNNGKLLNSLQSCNSDFDIFQRAAGSGKWSDVELDTLRKNIDDIKTILNADIIGPSFSIYDVSDFVNGQ
ncbi:ArnT family glycosyltransferase [Butyrivibrio sp. AE2032]|uniref:ArnT family glycosyltransferase n=1 Tax=Butyrivibrio sp. AE2032 TaxID=1458463 RepID=UPI0005590AE3|nr:glycosyltransferase family 39 protein [Butyrivibrio sp. AE2032]